VIKCYAGEILGAYFMPCSNNARFKSRIEDVASTNYPFFPRNASTTRS
jgi:hypothetical protein